MNSLSRSIMRCYRVINVVAPPCCTNCSCNNIDTFLLCCQQYEGKYYQVKAKVWPIVNTDNLVGQMVKVRHSNAFNGLGQVEGDYLVEFDK